MSDALWVDVHAKYVLLLPELGGLNNLLPRCSDAALRDGGEGVGSAGCCAGGRGGMVAAVISMWDNRHCRLIFHGR